MSWLDRFAMALSPSWGLSRVKAKLTARHYEAAQRSPRTDNWRRRATDANAADGPSLSVLRDLSRDVRRNNGWARRGVKVIRNNVVGRGIKAKSVSTVRTAEQDAVWKLWADTARCDYDGRLPFTGLQSLVMQTVVESGEALVVFEVANEADNLPIPIRLRVLEPDYLDTLKDGIAGPGPNAGPIVNGVELDRQGRRVAYWLFSSHPGSANLFGNRFESQRVPATNVLHIYEQERASAMRGVPWLASAIAKLEDFDAFEDAELVQQRIAACFGAFVTDLDGGGTSLGDEDDDDNMLETLEPGLIQYLPPGKSIEFATPPSTDNGQFTERQLRRIAAGLGVTYEDLSGDYSKVNFSSARMARMSHWQNVHVWRWHMLIPQFCDAVWFRVMALGAELFNWRAVPGVLWTAPPMPSVEPEKEGKAITSIVRSGAQSLSDTIRERGGDPDSVFKAYAEDHKKLDKLGLVFDSDPRLLNASGGAQQAGQPDEDDEPEVVKEPADEPAEQPGEGGEGDGDEDDNTAVA